MKKEKRNVFIDIIKGVAIFLMLWGHCIQYCIVGSGLDFWDNCVFKFIYSFHMPLFMLVSGFLFFYSCINRSLADLLKHRTQALLQPIIFGSFFDYLVTTAFFSALQGNFLEIFDGNWLSRLPSLWFLWSVLAASVVTAFVYKIFNTRITRLILFVIMIPVVAIFPNTSMNLKMYPYFLIGFYFAKYKDIIPASLLNLKYLSLPLFPILFGILEKKDSLLTTDVRPNVVNITIQELFSVLSWVNGLVGSIFIITLLQLIYQNISEKYEKSWLAIGLSKLGVKSLHIYVISVPFLSRYLREYFPKVLSAFNITNIFTANMLIYNFVFTFSLAIMYAFALYFLIKAMEKIGISTILFGK